MRRVRIGIIGAGAVTEWAVLPALSGPDIMAPPDTGAWWGRRPGSSSDIRYQAPACPEVVALADADLSRAQRVGAAARVRAIYADWRLMLREVEMDALLCLVPPAVAAEVAGSAGAAVRWLWIDGPPAPTLAETLALARRLQGRSLRVWCAHPLRQAAAHRAAWRLIERDTLGAVSALSLRWGTPFHIAEPTARRETVIGGTMTGEAASRKMESRADGTQQLQATAAQTNTAQTDKSLAGRPAEARRNGNAGVVTSDAPHLSPSYAALDMLLAFSRAAPPRANAANGTANGAGRDAAAKDAATTVPTESAAVSNSGMSGIVSDGTPPVSAVSASTSVMAAQCGGALSLWISFAHGPTATALFSGAEAWSVPLPRLEVCGTQGRSLVCESGRRLWLHQPREAAHLLEPPGLAAHVSAANVIGLSEDLKAFLTACAEDQSGAAGASISAAVNGASRDAASRDGASANFHSLSGAARALQLVEAVNESLAVGGPVAVPSLRETAPSHESLLARDGGAAHGAQPNAPGSSAGGRVAEAGVTLPLPL